MMLLKNKSKRLALKTAYYAFFLVFVVLPILIVLFTALLVLNKQFKNQAIENIKRSQETVIADLEADLKSLAIELSHIAYVNDNEILTYAAGTDTQELSVKNQYAQKFSQALGLVLAPVKESISVECFMKSGNKIYYKSEINSTQVDLSQTNWYQDALADKNKVYVGSYDINEAGDLYKGSYKDMLILIFALSPDISMDRSQKIEMIMSYHNTGVSDRISENNLNYLSGENKLGITQIAAEDGQLIFSTSDMDFSAEGYTCIKSPVKFSNITWYVESYIQTSELTADYWDTAILVFLAAVVVLVLAVFYSRHFLRSVVKPLEKIHAGLKQVEEGNMEIHLKADGQFEIRSIAHQFNAMVRRLKASMNEYEERIRSAQVNPEDYFVAMVKGEMTPEDVQKENKEFFLDEYAILSIYIDNSASKNKEAESATKLIQTFERNPIYASRCFLHKQSNEVLLVFYRISDEDYSYKIASMIKELQRTASKELGIAIFACVGKKQFGYAGFNEQIKSVQEKLCMRHLKGLSAMVDLNQEGEMVDQLLSLSIWYEKLASALYIADEKNVVQEKERLFATFDRLSLEDAKLQIYAMILALGNWFTKENVRFSEVFAQQLDYFDKVGRIDDIRSLKLWLNNYFTWIMDYSESKLSISNTDPIVKAKRYIADNYSDAELSLANVANHVELNEKYLSSCFTKTTGETFTSYLTDLRIQKACALLNNSNYKVYEISEMVGYYNVEHFSRMFKKLKGVSPAQFRKSKQSDASD